MPMITAGTNFWTRGQDAVIELIAATAAFQAWTSASDAIEAKERIYVHEAPEPERQPGDEDRDTYDAADYAALYPCCIVSLPEDGEGFEWQQIANDNQYQMECTGTRYSVRFEAHVTANQNNQQFIRTFENAVGGIVEAMIERNNSDPDEFGFTSLSGPRVYHEDYGRRTQGHIIGFKFEIARNVEIG